MVKKILLAIFLAFAGIFFLVNSEVLATREGYVDCGTSFGASCVNCVYNAATCAAGCPDCDCGSNCPYTPPTPTPTPPPGNGGPPPPPGCSGNCLPGLYDCSNSGGTLVGLCNDGTYCCIPPPTPPPPPPSCTVDLLPNSASVPLGDSATFVASVVPSNGSVSQVNFSSGNTGITTVFPASDTTVAYLTEATGVNIGSTTIRAGVIMGGAERCSDTSNITIIPPPPWWQVIDSDVITNGDIVSRIYPAGVRFILDGPGGYPGVAVYGGAQAVFGNGTVSSKGWLANTTSAWLTKKTYDYDYFRNLVPSTWWEGRTTTPDTISTADYFRTQGTAVDGYKLFYHSGDLIINATQNMLGQRAILLVDGGNLTINKNISLDDGMGFFMAIAGKDAAGDKGNILIDPLTTSLEGFYLAENLFRTGAGSVQLTVRGSVVGLGGVSMQRNLGAGNTTTPAEVFEYAPDLIFTYPSKLTVRKMRWKEVAP